MSKKNWPLYSGLSVQWQPLYTMLLSFKETKGKDGIFMVDLIEKNEVVQFKDGNFVLDVNVSSNGETVWLTLDQMSKLFNKNKSTISRHIANIFNEKD